MTSSPPGPPSSATRGSKPSDPSPRVDLGARHVRQVGGDKVGPGEPVAGWRQQVRHLELDTILDAVVRQVLRCQRQCFRGDVTRDQPQPAVCELAAEVQCQRQGNRARPGGEVPGDGARLPREPREDLGGRGFDDQLGLGAGDQGARIGSDPQRAPLLEAADVGDGLPRCSPLHGGGESVPRFEAGLGVREQPGSIPPGHVGEEELGVQPRRRLSGFAQSLCRRRQRLADAARRGDHPSPSSPRRRAWSASRSGSMRRSMSPSSSPGRLWTVTPTR